MSSAFASRSISPDIWTALSTVLPFSVRMSESGMIIWAGTVLQKRLGSNFPTPFADWFEIEPEATIGDLLREKDSTPFILRDRISSLRLRGHLTRLDDEETLLHMTPIVRSLREVNNAGLVLTDFSVASYAFEYLLGMSAMEASVRDSERVNARLIAKTQELRSANAKVSATLNVAREAIETKNGFFSLFSHEFRTPLASAYSTAEVLKRRLAGQEDSQRLVLRLLGDLDLLRSIMDQVGLYSEVEQGAVQVTLSPIFLDPLLDGLAAKFTTPNVSVTYTAEPAGLGVRSDASLLLILLSNLISNAIKFTRPPGTVKILSRSSGEHVVVTVRDQGIGIPKEAFQRVTDPYFRARNALSISGSGLGLAICKMCAKLLHATLEIESAEGVGTTISVSVPCIPPG